ncbi:DMT family transporter [Acinetobacter faecalis]|uniref:DMT family transporter n=1 Tax=Acinetobacter faecalis TaxID=2665161 RepID=UPI002A916A6A|nr:DMT family transporter [Acinetobacter faecalis]MDY6456052.1 DMT family transporter [Acinetobacter faecalis]MDY6481684.1 DMT family transporter [Acinetobacter faecalis]
MTNTNDGFLYGFIGVVIFAGSLPATRIGVMDFSPEFMTFARASIAGIIGLICLIATKQIKPNYRQFKSLLIIASGVVIGFPLLTAFALQTITAARAIVFVGMLPLSTALFAVICAKEKPKFMFWLFAILGSAFVAGFMLFNDQKQMFAIGDLYMIAAILICGLGYAEGGKLSRELGGWQVICWALTIMLPIMFILSFVYAPANYSTIQIAPILGLIYVALFSTLIGFFFWYKGLAIGGIAKVGQTQLMQPFIGMILSAVILHEHIDLSMIIVSIAVVICVGLAKKYA